MDPVRRMVTEAVKEVGGARLIGLGSGATVARFVDALAEHVKEHKVKVSVIPSSIQIQLASEKAGLEIASPSLIPNIQLAFDSADQIDSYFRMIKGGGGALFREKILLTSAEKTVIMAEESKYTSVLSRPVPIETHIFGLRSVWKRLEHLGGKPKLRMLDKGYPFMTENGNMILDTDFGQIEEPPKLEREVKSIPGVIEVGIFTCKIDCFYKAGRDGRVERISPKQAPKQSEPSSNVYGHRGTVSSLESVISRCLETERMLDGKWFALKDGNLVALASTNEELWKRLKKLRIKDVLLGYAPSKREKEAESLYSVLFKT